MYVCVPFACVDAGLCLFGVVCRACVVVLRVVYVGIVAVFYYVCRCDVYVQDVFGFCVF